MYMTTRKHICNTFILFVFCFETITFFYVYSYKKTTKKFIKNEQMQRIKGISMCTVVSKIFKTKNKKC